MPLDHIGVSPNQADRQARPYSPAVRAGDFIYVSGQVPIEASGEYTGGSIEAQTRRVMENIKSVLALAGATFGDVCKCTCWLADARDFRAFNRIYSEYFPDGYPARSIVESRLIIDAKVEIEAIAYKPRS